MEPDTPTKDILKLFSDRELVTKALKKGVMDALRRHKQAGNPVCEWRDGKVVWIAPEDIKIDDEP
jgi:hypothetical protein